MRTLFLLTLALLLPLAGCTQQDTPEAPTATTTGGPGDGAGATPAPSSGEPAAPATRDDTKEFTLPPQGSIEWKFRLVEGARMEYAWSATRPAYFDFHGDYDDGTDDFVSHKEATLASDEGIFTAPFSGRHGWYFQNGNTQTITITLHTTGEYEVVGRTGGNTAG